MREHVIVKGKMTTSPYSFDLRKKIVEYINKGNSQKEASLLFSVHRNTINGWIIRNRKEGHYKARVRVGNKSRVDYDKLAVYMKDNPNTNLSEVGCKFGVSMRQAGRLLHKLGFSYKKKPIPMWKQIMRKEESI